MRWIADTSAWSRRHHPEIGVQLDAIIGEKDTAEFVLSPTVLLELMRGPQGEQVAAERRVLTSGMAVLPVDGETFELAANAMQTLATVSPEAHRLPMPDLVTAALAHQRGCGIVHLDGDFEQISAHAGLRFEQRRLDVPSGGSSPRGR